MREVIFYLYNGGSNYLKSATLGVESFIAIDMKKMSDHRFEFSVSGWDLACGHIQIIITSKHQADIVIPNQVRLYGLYLSTVR